MPRFIPLPLSLLRHPRPRKKRAHGLLHAFDRLELDRRQVAEARMQALGIVDIGDEPPEAALSLFERAVLLHIHLLALERLEEALGLGVLVGVASRRHADPRPDSFQPRNVVAAGVLDATV